jgi:hypothetical protein
MHFVGFPGEVDDRGADFLAVGAAFFAATVE